MSKKTSTIRIAKGRFQKRVPVSVNGQVAYIPVDTDTAVGDHIIEALKAAEVEFTVISSSGETDGSESGVGSEPSTIVIGADSPKDDDTQTEEAPDALTTATELGQGGDPTPVEIVAKTVGGDVALTPAKTPTPTPAEKPAKATKNAPAKKPAAKKPAAK